MDIRLKALSYLKEMLGEDAEFREGQYEAIEDIIMRKRLLVVQKTGWGKSVVYFIAVRILRNQGSGPAILISPLLALMRNQILNAQRIGINAITINSTNRDQREYLLDNIKNNQCD